MCDASPLLHNMSAPPKSVVKYSGLADLSTIRRPTGSKDSSVGFNGAGVFGIPVRFALPVELVGQTPADVLRYLGVSLRVDAQADAKPVSEADAHSQLCELIDTRANELPLPEGCVVVASLPSHRLIWTDALSALAILAKSSEAIWLRSKSPALSAALARTQVTLLVPPAFAHQLPDRLPQESL
jgi:hypothetical protein